MEGWKGAGSGSSGSGCGSGNMMEFVTSLLHLPTSRATFDTVVLYLPFPGHQLCHAVPAVTVVLLVPLGVRSVVNNVN